MALSRWRGAGRSATPTIIVSLLCFPCLHLKCLVYYDHIPFLSVSFLLSPVLFPVARNNHVLSFFFGPCYFTLLMSTFHVRYHCFSTWVALIFFASGYVNYLLSPAQSTSCLLFVFISGLGGSTDCTLIYSALVKPHFGRVVELSCTIILSTCTFTLKIPLSISIAFILLLSTLIHF